MNTGDDRGESLRNEFGKMAEVAGDGAHCPPPEVLWKSGRAELHPAENEAVLLHLGDCTACAAAWRLAHDLAEDSLRGRSPVSGRRFAVARWAPLATAAVLVIGFASVAVYQNRKDGVSPAVYRTQEGDWLRPVVADGAALPRAEFVLRWEPGPEGTTYDVRVTTERLEPVARGRRLDGAEFRVPAEALENLPAGARVFWQVTAHLPDGRVLDSASFFVTVE